MHYNTYIKDFWALHGDAQTEQYVDTCMDILNVIHDQLKSKNMSFQQFCAVCRLDKKTAESWLSPMHNFTIRELITLENVLGLIFLTEIL